MHHAQNDRLDLLRSSFSCGADRIMLLQEFVLDEQQAVINEDEVDILRVSTLDIVNCIERSYAHYAHYHKEKQRGLVIRHE